MLPTAYNLQGLAYSISGGWDTSPVDHPGVFAAEASTAFPAELLDLLTGSLQVRSVLGPSSAQARAKPSLSSLPCAAAQGSRFHAVGQQYRCSRGTGACIC